MTIHLPEELERFVKAEVLKGRFASEDDLLAEAVSLLRQQEQHDAGSKPLTEDEWERRLLASGLLSSIPPAGVGASDFQPIRIQGEPLSETLIRERR
jgi:Arc/MetJ-type ribon-helix-helix transcriptional regulator